MDDWMDDINLTNWMELLEGPLSSTTSKKRHATTTPEELEEHISSIIPKETIRKRNWALRLFRSWFSEWHTSLDGNLKVYDPIEDMSASNLDYCLQYFIADVRKENGSKYPPRTLKEIYAMIQHYCNNELNKNWSFFNDVLFVNARKALDAEMRLSAREGNVTVPKRSEPISKEIENDLWDKGVFGEGNSQQLQNTLIFLIGLNFGLRANMEHKNLLFGANSQFQLIQENEIEKLQYKEHCSKSRHFGLNQSKLEPKIVVAEPNVNNQKKCIVRLYKLFVSHRPESSAKKGHESFYLSPITNPTSNVWYKCSPLGIHQLEKTTRNILLNAGYQGNYTNTSLRRTAKCRLVEAGIPNSVSKSIIGHLSNADEVYVSKNTLRNSVSNALQCTNNEMEQKSTSRVTIKEHLVTKSGNDDTISITVEKGDNKVTIKM